MTKSSHLPEVHYCLPSSIVVLEDRQRKSLNPEKISKLAKSIKLVGLIYPPVVRKEGKRLILATGLRRLIAMRQLIAVGEQIKYLGDLIIPGHIPYVEFCDLSALDAKVVELEENLQREDLTWQEKAQAIAEIHHIRVEQSPGWRMGDTVLELGYEDAENQTYLVRNKLILADNLNRPEVSSAPSEQEALKVLRRLLHDEFVAKLGTIIQPGGRHTLRLCDAIEGMKTLPPSTIDVIITDPPYGIGADKFAFNTKSVHRYKDTWKSVQPLMVSFASEAFRVAKVNAHLYVFCDVRHFIALATAIEAAEWVVWARPLVWVKDTGTAPSGSYGPLHSYETVLYALKGDKPVATVANDIIQIPTVKKKDFAAQKPTALYENLLRRSIMAGDTILDPFCGSGTVFRAADKLGLTAIGFDNDPVAIGLSKEAIEGKREE